MISYSCCFLIHGFPSSFVAKLFPLLCCEFVLLEYTRPITITNNYYYSVPTDLIFIPTLEIPDTALFTLTVCVGYSLTHVKPPSYFAIRSDTNLMIGKISFVQTRLLVESWIVD